MQNIFTNIKCSEIILYNANENLYIILYDLFSRLCYIATCGPFCKDATHIAPLSHNTRFSKQHTIPCFIRYIRTPQQMAPSISISQNCINMCLQFSQIFSRKYVRNTLTSEIDCFHYILNVNSNIFG